MQQVLGEQGERVQLLLLGLVVAIFVKQPPKAAELEATLEAD